MKMLHQWQILGDHSHFNIHIQTLYSVQRTYVLLINGPLKLKKTNTIQQIVYCLASITNSIG